MLRLVAALESGQKGDAVKCMTDEMGVQTFVVLHTVNIGDVLIRVGDGSVRYAQSDVEKALVHEYIWAGLSKN